MDYRLLTSLAYPLYIILLAFLVVITVIGTVAGGAQRWLTIGEFFLQPSELTKIALILALAHYLADREEKMESLLTPLGALGILAPAVALIYLQPNLSTALSVLAIGVVMLLVSGLRLRHTLLLGGMAAAAGVPAWQYLLEDYMKERVMMLIEPESRRSGQGSTTSSRPSSASARAAGWAAACSAARRASSTSCGCATPTSSSRSPPRSWASSAPRS